MPGLLASVRRCFTEIGDPRARQRRIQHTLPDTLCSALAMFSLKYPSLLQFDQGARQEDPVRHNLRTLYGVSEAPCDTQMRSLLDPVEPGGLRPQGLSLSGGGLPTLHRWLRDNRPSSSPSAPLRGAVRRRR
jgi:hypothetical protein